MKEIVERLLDIQKEENRRKHTPLSGYTKNKLLITYEKCATGGCLAETEAARRSAAQWKRCGSHGEFTPTVPTEKK